MALGSTQPLTGMSTRSISWSKDGRCVGLITLPPSCIIVLKSRSLILLEPSGPVQAFNGTALPLPLPLYIKAVSLYVIHIPTCFDIFMPSSGNFTLFYSVVGEYFNTLRTGSFKLFKRPFPGFLIILTL